MRTVITPVFVEFIPEKLEEGKLYISQTYATAQHKCCCGCGQRVVTPLNPTAWRLTVDGSFVSLYPSIGNWGFPCQSHYWILQNEVRWSYQMTQTEINAGRRHDAMLKQKHFETAGSSSQADKVSSGSEFGEGDLKESFWQKLKRWLFG